VKGIPGPLILPQSRLNGHRRTFVV
jgi:hypothetical protein